jgi:uncharacterized protein (TIRG00374 family)
MVKSLVDFLKSKLSESKIWKRIASVIIFLAVILALIFLLPWQEIKTVFQNADLIKIALAFLVLLPVQYLVGMSYQLMAKSQNMEMSALRFMILNLIIGFYQIFIPASFFGSSFRWFRYARYSKKPAESFAVIAYNKVFNVFLVLLLSSGFLFFNETDSIKITSIQVIALLIAVTCLLLLIPSISLMTIKFFPPVEKNAKKNRFISLIRKWIIKILSAFINFRELGISSQLKIILYGITAQLLQIFSYWIIASALGIRLTFAQLGLIRATLLLAANLPLNLTPGIGVREISLVALLTAMNIALEYAAAMSIVIFVRSLFYGVLGGVIEGIQIIMTKREPHTPDRQID